MMAQTKMLRRLAYGLAISLLMLPGMALAHGEHERARVMVGEYLLTPVFAQAPKTGDNFLYVQIVDGMGKPVTGAAMEISAMPVENGNPHQDGMASGRQTMDDIGDMQGMSTMLAHDMSGMGRMAGMGAAPTQARFNELPRMTGDYFGVVNFSAVGHWLLNTQFSINNQTFNVDFPVEVGGASSGLAILAAFLVLNACIIGIASFTKRKSVTA